MPILQNNKIIVPYFNKSEKLKVGLNLLGLRNPSELLFTQLLPGLNNVTLRIRYYSFYCWIISSYYSRCVFSKVTPSRENFNKFIRRAEYLLAVIEASNENNGGLPGISYAVNHFHDFSDYVDVENSADIANGHSTYWANPGGALAQYYVSSLLDMGLLGYVKEDSSLINISSGDDSFVNGESLCRVFANSIGEEGSTIFLSCIENGRVKPDDLAVLVQVFNMHKLHPDKEECKSLIDFLLQKDYPGLPECDTFRRRETIKYFLIYCSKERNIKSDLDFAEFMHDRCLDETYHDDTAIGWYAYYLNDMWQYYFTEIFSYILEFLKSKSRITVSQISQEVQKDITQIYTSENICDVINYEVMDINESAIESQSVACQAFYRILKLVAINKDFLYDKLQSYGLTTYNYFNFSQKIENNTSTLDQFVREVICDDIIYRHYALSFQKQQYTGIATQKFIIENDTITFCASYLATHTSPRILSLRNFLLDLNMIDDKWNLTKYGKDILTSIE